MSRTSSFKKSEKKELKFSPSSNPKTSEFHTFDSIFSCWKSFVPSAIFSD